MTAYEQQCPGELEDLDFLIFGVIKSLLEGPERPGRDWNESGSGERGGENPGKQKVKECREKIDSELHLADGKGEAGEHTPCLPSAPPYSMLHLSDSLGPQSSLEKGIRKAIENGEDVGTFPVLKIADPSVPGGVWRSHVPIEWKRVATLKEACTKHGPNSPFVIAMLETLSGQFVLTPNDWKSLARACLTPGQKEISTGRGQDQLPIAIALPLKHSVQILLLKEIGQNRPECTIWLNGIPMTGLLDTGADRTCLSGRSVPRHRKLKESQRPVWGIGGCQNTLETMHPVKWEAEDRQGTVWPLVIPGLSFNIWGRDIMSRLGMKLSNF
ncbi:uncharacterized protein [Notamacropus eugenii]|uniref:uncharacterized protein n=1 Tax=Notamacropus eugenii TaxID=9315 RepID=UPI003B66CFBB